MSEQDEGELDEPRRGLPAWLVERDDEDGDEGLRMLGHGEDE